MLKILQALLTSIGFLSIATGVLLIVIPRNKLVQKTHVRRWLFENSITALLDRYHTIEKPAYKFHRSVGAALTIGALIMLTPLLELYDHPTLIIFMNFTIGFWGTHALILASWMLSIFALVIGVILFMRPSALKAFEVAANRWIELFPSAETSKSLTNKGINRLVLGAPRFSGLLLVALGLVCLLASSIWLSGLS